MKTPMQLWADSKVEASSLEDFLTRFYKSDRYEGRGKEYAEAIRNGARRDLSKDGVTIISRHDNITGATVAHFGAA